jgi:hypothetical protein
MTLKQKIDIYEQYLCKISDYYTQSENDGIKELLNNADRWNHARKEQLQYLDQQTKRLFDWTERTLYKTPETDRKIRHRERALNKKEKVI